MKALLKYITPLLFSGVIIPFYLHWGNVKMRSAFAVAKVTAAGHQLKPDAINFSFIDDVAAKLLPVIKIFQSPCNL